MMALYAPKASESVLADGRLTLVLVHRFRILKVVRTVLLLIANKFQKSISLDFCPDTRAEISISGSFL